MLDLEKNILNYLDCCKYQKNLNEKTLKAYRIDLKQFYTYMDENALEPSRLNIISFITYLHSLYAPKSAKRKIASVKALFTYLEYEDIVLENPFSKIRLKFKEPFLLPRTISLGSLQKLFEVVHEHEGSLATENSRKRACVRDAAVLELLFAAGLRVSELCSLKQRDMDLEQGVLRIYGKGAKERMIQVTNRHVLDALYGYLDMYRAQLMNSEFFFLNRLDRRLSEQSVRFMIKRYTKLAGVPEHLTPHMFRHTFATMLLEEDVDIRYIQQILGHSSIVTTQIYTHVAAGKQKEILTMKHPRNRVG